MFAIQFSTQETDFIQFPPPPQIIIVLALSSSCIFINSTHVVENFTMYSADVPYLKDLSPWEGSNCSTIYCCT